MATTALPEIGDIGRSPVRPDTPVGGDPRDSETYAALEAELNKQVDLHANNSTDWNRVVDLAVPIIRNESKDLGAGVYLVAGLTEVYGSRGLAAGVPVLRDLVTTYWAAMYPPLRRMRKRHNLLDWLLDALRKALSQDLEPLPPDEHALLQSAWADLDAFLRENDDEGPVLSRMRDRLAAIPIEQEEEQKASDSSATDSQVAPDTGSGQEPRQQVATNSAGGMGGTPPAVSAPTVDIPSDGDDFDLEPITRPIYAALGDVVGQCLERSVSEPLLYRLNRQAARTFLVRVPSAVRSKTAIPAPNFQVTDQLDKLTAGGDPEALIRFAEAQLPRFPLWLDLDRITYQSLTRLEVVDAAAVVAAETLSLVQRLTGLETLSFHDGTPFADPRTRDWLTRMQPRDDNHSPADTETTATSAAETATGAEEAADLAAQGHLDEAIALLDAARLRSSPSGAVRSRLSLCRLIQTHRPDMDVKPWLSPLMNDLERYALEAWDPGLSAEILSLAAEVADEETRPATLARLATVDPVAAWTVAKAG